MLTFLKGEKLLCGPAGPNCHNTLVNPQNSLQTPIMSIPNLVSIPPLQVYTQTPIHQPYN